MDLLPYEPPSLFYLPAFLRNLQAMAREVSGAMILKRRRRRGRGEERERRKKAGESGRERVMPARGPQRCPT